MPRSSKPFLFTVLAFLLGADSSGFAQEQVAPADLSAAQLEHFEKQVRPLLIEHCYECHAGEERSGGLLLDSRAGWNAGGDSGPAVVVGKPQQSRLIEAVRYQNQDLQMPPDGRLSDSDIRVLEEWVLQGAVDPREGTVNAHRQLSGMSVESGRSFWSFQSISNPSIPFALEHRDWVRNPVDAFILQQLEAKSLTPAGPAERRTLIRRVTYDLTGLPPTPEEVRAFLEDQSPHAFARVVDRLLSSPQYGVRWGRHWLDVARYADSNGLDENLAFGNAWRYRDYVVDAFNHDKPFDRFLTEQLAGDLVPYANEETRIGTGFLALGAKVLAEPDREKLTMDTIDEQIDSVGKAFLGMTLGCVRCHDHKFDPIKQTDYYALAAIFKSTKTFGDTNTGAIKHWYEHSFASEKELAQLKLIDSEIAKRKSAATQFKTKSMSAIRTQSLENAAVYLAAAALFDTTTSFARVTKIADSRDLHARILHHCRLHLAYNPDDPFVAEWHQLRDAGATEAEIQAHFGDLFALASKPIAQADKPPVAGSQIAQTPENPAIENPAIENPAIENSATQEARPLQDDQAKSSTNSADPGDRESKIDPQRVERAKAALKDASGFITVPPQPEFAFDDATLAEYYRLMEEARVLESAAADESAAMGVSDGTVFTTLPIHIRGSHRNLGEAVAREFPEVMRTSATRPIFPRNQSGRLALAEWMASSRHPLTARVFVNRVWRWHFGRGLVKSTENFGVLGDTPSHPELLDWLARWFIESGWSTKDLHRLILLSSTYQMASTNDLARAPQADPENQLLWKFPMRRLEAEEIRDSILTVAGRLDFAMGGKTVPLRNRQFVFNHTSVDHTKYDSLRRAVYLPVIRNNLYTFFEQFDFPDPTMPTGSRSETIVAPQALLILNDQLVLDSASRLAQRILAGFSQTEPRIQYAYELTLGRPPSQHEIELAESFLNDAAKRLSVSFNESNTNQSNTANQTLVRAESKFQPQPDSNPQLAPVELEAAWSAFCQCLIASNEFMYVR